MINHAKQGRREEILTSDVQAEGHHAVTSVDVDDIAEDCFVVATSQVWSTEFSSRHAQSTTTAYLGP